MFFIDRTAFIERLKQSVVQAGDFGMIHEHHVGLVIEHERECIQIR
jgi:hypothetical protein